MLAKSNHTYGLHKACAYQVQNTDFKKLNWPKYLHTSVIPINLMGSESVSWLINQLISQLIIQSEDQKFKTYLYSDTLCCKRMKAVRGA